MDILNRQQLLDESSRLYRIAKSVRADNSLSLECKLRLLDRAHRLAAEAAKLASVEAYRAYDC